VKHKFVFVILGIFLIGSNSLPVALLSLPDAKPIVQPVEEELTNDDSEEAEERDDWFTFQRAYPFDEIPVNLRRNAWEKLRRERTQRDQVTLEPTAAATWRTIGPTPTFSAFPTNWGKTSGRINAVAISPADSQLILVGAATGGVFRSTNGGATFAPASDDQADLAVGAIAFSKSNPQIVYAGMGDYKQGYLGSGILRSTNAGQSWTRVSNSSLPSPGSVSEIVVDPTDPNRVYLGQYLRLDTDNRRLSSGFYYSTDGGVNWTKTLTCLPKDLVMDASNPRTLYVGAAVRSTETEVTPAGLYRSTDAGLTWTRIYATPYDANRTTDVRVAVTPANPQLLYIFIGGFNGSTLSLRVEVSSDGGITWANRGAPGVDTAQFGYNTYLFVDPVDTSTLYLGSRDVFKSTNGGASWANKTNNFYQIPNGWDYNPQGSNTHPDQHAFTFAPDGTIYIGNDGGLFKSNDGSSSFQDLNSSLSLSMFIGVSLHPTDKTLSYGGTQDNGTQRRLSGSDLWQEFATGDGGRVVINPEDPSIVFTTYIRGTVYRFSQNTANYDRQVAFNSTFSEPNSGTRIAFYPPFVSNGVDSTLYFGTWRLFTSTDLGSSWNAPGGNVDLTKGARSLTNNADDVLTAIGVNGANRNVIYTGSTGGRAMVSANGGASWGDITAGLPNRSITGILVEPANVATAYLTLSGFGTAHIFKTTNTGATWTNISSNLPDVPVNAMLIDPLDATVLFAGTDIGVFRSTNNGASWELFNDGMPPVIVTAFSAQQNGLIQAATYGRGIYELNRDLSGGVPSISAAAFQTTKLLVISGSNFGSSPRIFINDVEQTERIKKSNNLSITLKAKAKALGVKAGDNTIKVISANSAASNVYTLRY